MYSTSWSSYQINSGDANRNMNAHRASTAPAATSYSAHPASLMPGHTPRPIHRPELYFTNPTQMPVPFHSYNNYYSPPPPPVPQYPRPHIPDYHHQSLPVLVPPPLPPPRPPLPQALSLNALRTHTQPTLSPSLPPVPPKPFQSPYSPTGPLPPRCHGPPNLESTSGRNPSPDDSDIALAMALSKSISKEEQEARQTLISEEEAQLARALEASLIEVQSPIQLEFDIDSISSSSHASTPVAAFIPPRPSHDDEAFARLLASEQDLAAAEASINIQRSAEFTNATHSKSYIPIATGHVQENEQSLKSSTHQGAFAGISMENQSGMLLSPGQDSAKGDPRYDQASAPPLVAEERRNVALLVDKTSEILQTNNFVTNGVRKEPPQYFATTSQPVLSNTLHDDDNVFSRLPVAGEDGDSSSKGKLPQYSVTDVHDSSSKVNCDDDEAFARLLVAGQRDTSTTNNISDSHTNTYGSLFIPQGLPHPFVDHQSPIHNANINVATTLQLVTSESPDTLPNSIDALAARPPDAKVFKEGPPQYSHSDEEKAPNTIAALETSNHKNQLGSEALSSPTLQREAATLQASPKPPLYSLQIHRVAPDRLSDTKTEVHPTSSDENLDSTIVSRQVKGPGSFMPTSSPTSPPLYSDGQTLISATSSLIYSSASTSSIRPESEIISAMDLLHPGSPSFSRHQDLLPSTAQVDTAPLVQNTDPFETPASNVPHNEPLDPPQLRPSPSTLNLNAFVDRELFNGVSLGFMAPKISDQISRMTGEMPLIISLPYGKARPLHLQGPSWKHLLKLMAKLSGTRVEPSLDAITVTKTPPKLRTVVQFVKPHHNSPTWRSIFYFTIDYPSPQPIRNAGVNDLPYSYSLAGIPTLLRDAADTPLSKTYTIPASETVPYPNLPIAFPELALYLQAVLDESRRYLNDASSGNRKLAKMIGICYPLEDYVQEAPDRSSVGGLFKRVMGLSNRSYRRGGNEEIYELVTPFVPDEWG